MWPSGLRGSAACQNPIPDGRIPTSARQGSGPSVLAISAICRIRRSHKPKAKPIWQLTCKAHCRRRYGIAQFWRSNRKHVWLRSSTSRLIWGQGGCRHRPCGGGSSSGTGRPWRQNYGAGSTAVEGCCPDWWCAGRLKSPWLRERRAQTGRSRAVHHPRPNDRATRPAQSPRIR